MENLKIALKSKKGITLIALVVTIIVLIILSAITIYILFENTGLLNKALIASEESRKSQATETMNLKITNIQIASYVENQKLPTLQYLADKLCEDNDMEYVILKSEKTASLTKITVGENDSILTKLKEYPYKFEINSSLQLASINGDKVSNIENSSSLIPDFEILIEKVGDVSITINVESAIASNSDIIGYIIFMNNEAIDVTNQVPYTIKILQPNTTYSNIYVSAIDKKGNLKKSKNTLEQTTKNIDYVVEGLLSYYEGTRNTKSGHNASSTVWEDLNSNNNISLVNINNNSVSGWIDNGINLDGTDDGLYLGDQFKDLFKNSCTLEIVVRFNDSSRDCIFGNYLEDHNINFEKFSDATSRVYWNSGSPNLYSSTTHLVTNKVMTLTYKLDKSTGKIYEYKNGALINTFSDSRFTSYNYDWTNAWVGKDNRVNSLCLGDTIYNIRIYNTAITDSDIQSNYERDALVY